MFNSNFWWNISGWSWAQRCPFILYISASYHMLLRLKCSARKPQIGTQFMIDSTVFIVLSPTHDWQLVRSFWYLALLSCSQKCCKCGLPCFSICCRHVSHRKAVQQRFLHMMSASKEHDHLTQSSSLKLTIAVKQMKWSLVMTHKKLPFFG